MRAFKSVQLHLQDPEFALMAKSLYDINFKGNIQFKGEIKA